VAFGHNLPKNQDILMSGGWGNRGKHNLPLPPPNHPSLLTKAIQLYVVKKKVNINKLIPKGMDEPPSERLYQSIIALRESLKELES